MIRGSDFLKSRKKDLSLFKATQRASNGLKNKITSFLIFFLVICFGSSGWANNGAFTIGDEWDTINWLTFSTERVNNVVDLNPLAFKIIPLALAQGIKPVISDQDANIQEKILSDLINSKIIKNRNQVMIIDNPLPNAWARDHAPINRFDKNNKNSVSITGTVSSLWDVDKANKSINNLAQAIKLNNKQNVPLFSFIDPNDPNGNKQTLPLRVDGGDWMTISRKTLITTENFYIYYDKQDNKTTEAIKAAVDPILKDQFGIEKVLTLKPLKKDADGYDLKNDHVDLQVRTLPNNKVIVASVPKTDPQHEILEDNAKTLTDAGFQVIRIANAQETGGKKYFKSYTNSLFLNKTVVIPNYNDIQDNAAIKAYQDALGNTYKIEKVDASEAIKYSGAARCVARELPRTPSYPAGKEAASRKNPTMSFDASTGFLTFTHSEINFLGNPEEKFSYPAYVNDPLLGTVLKIEGLVLDPIMSADGRYSFVGGNIRIEKGGVDFLTTTLPVFSIFSIHPDGALDMFGVLANINIESATQSEWLDGFIADVLNVSYLLPDFFASSPIDLIALSDGFTQSFYDIQLNSIGIVGNGASLIPESSTWLLLATGIGGLLLVQRRRKKRTKFIDRPRIFYWAAVWRKK